MVLNKEETRQLQLVELDIFKEFISVCDKLHLRYYILGGTLLGAVRHQGFIPWDDDVDVGMLREDYEVFLEQAVDLLPKHLFLQSLHTEDKYYRNSAKIRHNDTAYIETIIKDMNIHHGVFIDIFPLDNYPVKPMEQWWFQTKAKMIGAAINNECGWDKESSWVKKLLKKPLKWKYPTMHSAVLAKENLYKSVPFSGLVANHCGAWGKKEIVPAQWYAEGCQLQFEGLMVSAPKEYEKWLTQVYGDYMQMPPEEKRVTHHLTEVIDINQSYRNYMKANEE